MKRAVVTGGGSAGHVIPALPVIEALQAAGWEVSFIGSDSGLEERLVAPLGTPYFRVQTGKLRRYFSFANLTDALKIPLGILQAFAILGRVKPRVVFSKGGFVAFPVVFAAWLRRIPVVAHESDLSPGLANRLSLPFIATLCVNFDATRVSARRVIHTGTPIRAALRNGNPDRGAGAANLPGERPMLVVVGGSLGARRLNEVTRAALPALVETFEVLHVCGAGQLDPAADTPGYAQREFVTDGWGDILAAAAIVVSRAGANALHELLTLGKPNLLVPLPTTASRGDQIENAAYAEARGFSAVLPDAELSPATLVEGVRTLHADLDAWRARLAEFRAPDATAAIVGELEAVARENREKGRGT